MDLHSVNVYEYFTVKFSIAECVDIFDSQIINSNK